MRIAALAAFVGSVALSWNAAAFDSKCYNTSGKACQEGIDTARNRWLGGGDEHRQLWTAAVEGLGLPAHLLGDVALDVFVSNGTVGDLSARVLPIDPSFSGGSVPSVAPVPFALATALANRRYSIDEMAQLPDMSYSLWDWASGNETCPINGPGGASYASSSVCHAFASHMGAMNSNHFLPQASYFFFHYHRIALERAGACANMRARLAATPQFDRFVQACDVEAFTFEAVAHHFLQDAWSMGHMWERWGGPDLEDFGAGGEDGRARAILVAMTSGLVHGVRGVLQAAVPLVDWADPLCAPLDPATSPIDGVRMVPHPPSFLPGDSRTITAGVGDLYLSLMPRGYRPQYDHLLACARSSIGEVAQTAGLPAGSSGTVPLPSSGGFEIACLQQRATNGSMYLGFGLDWIDPAFGYRRLEFDAYELATMEIVAAETKAGVTIWSALEGQYRSQMSRLADLVHSRGINAPGESDLAGVGLPPLLDVQPNGFRSYRHDPPARYTDPLSPGQVSFTDAGGSNASTLTANVLARAFHRAHATDWCTVTTEADLASLRGRSFCPVCTEFVSRHIRVGKGADEYDKSQEPLCQHLASSPAYVYADPDDKKPDSAAKIWCGCAENPDGGKGDGGDNPPDPAGGMGGGSNAGTGGTGGNSGGSAGNGGGGSPWDTSKQWVGSLVTDPHLFKPDGGLVDFQAVGEFVLVSDGGGFTVQTRLAPWNWTSRTITGISAVATRVGDTRIGIYLNESPPLRIAGSPTTLAGPLALPAGGSVELKDGAYIVRWPNGDLIQVRVADNHLDLVFAMQRAPVRHFAGVAGNVDGNPDNDYSLRDGTTLNGPLDRHKFYDVFAQSWRISQTESLFDYPPSMSTIDFTDLSFPDGIVTAASLSASDYAEALRVCTNAGVTAPGVREACILDYGTTKDAKLVQAFLGLPPPVKVESIADYHNDFEAGGDGAWVPATITRAPVASRVGLNEYAGPFAQELVTLTRSGLRSHTTVTVAFDQYAIGDWNGEGWKVGVIGGPVLLDATFSNTASAQSYPDLVGAGTHPARTGAVAIDALSPPGGSPTDTVYHHRFTFAHTDSSLALTFQAPVLSATGSPRWGLDNVEILLDASPDVTGSPDGGVIGLPGGGVTGLPDGQVNDAGGSGGSCSGASSGALNFGGNQYVTIPDSASLRPEDFTLEAWVKVGTRLLDFSSIVGKVSTDAGNHSFALWLSAGFLEGTAEGPAGLTNVFTGWLAAPGRWYHYAYTFDRTARMQFLYADGVQVASGEATVPSIAYDSHPVVIGGGDGKHGSNPDVTFVGDIDEVRIWSVARSAAEIAAGRLTCIPADTPGLRGYWHFDEASGQIVNDASRQGNVGYLGSTNTVDAADPVRFLGSGP